MKIREQLVTTIKSNMRTWDICLILLSFKKMICCIYVRLAWVEERDSWSHGWKIEVISLEEWFICLAIAYCIKNKGLLSTFTIEKLIHFTFN